MVGFTVTLCCCLPQLLAAADSKEVQEIVTLLNQLVLKFKVLS